jgi:hypothetical protein
MNARDDDFDGDIRCWYLFCFIEEVFIVPTASCPTVPWSRKSPPILPPPAKSFLPWRFYHPSYSIPKLHNVKCNVNSNNNSCSNNTTTNIWTIHIPRSTTCSATMTTAVHLRNRQVSKFRRSFPSLSSSLNRFLIIRTAVTITVTSAA